MFWGEWTDDLVSLRGLTVSFLVIVETDVTIVVLPWASVRLARQRAPSASARNFIFTVLLKLEI